MSGTRELERKAVRDRSDRIHALPEMNVETVRTGTSAECLARAMLDHLTYGQGRHPAIATTNDWYMALAHAVRDRALKAWVATVDRFLKKDVRVVSYLSAEFLMGPHLANNLVNLDIFDEAREACREVGLDLDELIQAEEEPGLGNGGLGRLAACFLESLATLQVPAIGYGVRYEFGIFDQEIRDGRQVEITDKWLRWGNPWEIARPEIAYDVPLGGRTQTVRIDGRHVVRWIPDRVVKGIAYDTPVVGYRANTSNLLRLWKSEACESFDFQAFNVGDYWGAVESKVVSENLSKVLYPNDEPDAGKRLRLEQQFFFVSCSLRDMVRIHLAAGNGLDTFPDAFAVQLNDTHPAIGVAELMRLLLDLHGMDWDPAWEITKKTFSYTNHTLLPEALETWPLPLFGAVLPRHLEIIYEINRRFLDEVRFEFPGDDALVERTSLIDERNGDRRVRMAHLATVGSHTVNGVAAMHTELLKDTVLADFHRIEPDKIRNVTNGVTPRRWLLLSNPKLAELIGSRIGDRWVTHPEDELPALEKAIDDASFLDAWREVQHANKKDFAAYIRTHANVTVDPDSMFDVQVKRIHEYKRQHLNVLHVITLYQRLLKDPDAAFTPRTVIFGGKAAPGYFLAKQIIELIHAVAAKINDDPVVDGRLRVAFIPDFNVTVSQHIYPAADLSEQISTAGKEASGTGNMKFAMNGALTIGTLDGANVEIRDAVGEDNFFLFGMSVEQVRELRQVGYEPRRWYDEDDELRAAIDAIRDGTFAGADGERFTAAIDSLLDGGDPYMVLADYRSYVDCQERVSEAYRDARRWDRMSVLNTARTGRFSSDRSIREYCEAIWKVDVGEPVGAVRVRR